MKKWLCSLLFFWAVAVHSNSLKIWEFGKEGPQNLHSERATIAVRQGASENANFEGNPTLPKPNSAGCSLQRYLEKGEVGDFIVMKVQKTVTLVRIHSLQDGILTLEEVSLGAMKTPPSWQEWLSQRAPGHSSWSLTQIDLQSGKVLLCYSLSKDCQIQLDEKESPLATLLHLSIEPASDDHIRKIGAPPLGDEIDRRKVWTPPFVFEGKKVQTDKFDMFEAVWPEDGSELQNTRLILYFDHAMRIPLPVWIEWTGSNIKAHVQIIDSGKKLSSPARKFAR